MTKEKQIEFLEKTLEVKIGQFLTAKIDAVALETLQISNNNDQIRKKHLEAMLMRDLYEKQVGAVRQLIKEVSDGKAV